MTTRQNLTNIISVTYKCIERTPKKEDFTVEIFEKISETFPSFENALKEAKIFDENIYKQKLLSKLKNFYNTNNKVPNTRDIKDPGVKAYRRLFGSWDEALKLAGILEKRNNNKNTIAIKEKYKEELIKNILDYNNQYKKVPTGRDIKNPSVKTYMKVFGSWNNALKIAGLDKENNNSFINCKKQLIAKIVEFYKIHGRVPNGYEMKNPSVKKYRKVFGNWANAIKEAELSKEYKFIYRNANLKMPQSINTKSLDNVVKEKKNNETMEAVSENIKVTNKTSIKNNIKEKNESPKENKVINMPIKAKEPVLNVNKEELLNDIVSCMNKFGASFDIKKLKYPLNYYERAFNSYEEAYEEASLHYILGF